MSPGHDFGAACLRLSRQPGGERHLHKTKKHTVPSDFWLEDSREGRLVLKPTCNLKRKPRGVCLTAPATAHLSAVLAAEAAGLRHSRQADTHQAFKAGSYSSESPSSSTISNLSLIIPSIQSSPSSSPVTSPPSSLSLPMPSCPPPLPPPYPTAALERWRNGLSTERSAVRTCEPLKARKLEDCRALADLFARTEAFPAMYTFFPADLRGSSASTKVVRYAFPDYLYVILFVHMRFLIIYM